MPSSVVLSLSPVGADAPAGHANASGVAPKQRGNFNYALAAGFLRTTAVARSRARRRSDDRFGSMADRSMRSYTHPRRGVCISRLSPHPLPLCVSAARMARGRRVC
jgi:hypothetical protein